jgi:hypothetical protein
MKTIKISFFVLFFLHCGSRAHAQLEPHCRWMVEAIYSNQVTEDWRSMTISRSFAVAPKALNFNGCSRQICMGWVYCITPPGIADEVTLAGCQATGPNQCPTAQTCIDDESVDFNDEPYQSIDELLQPTGTTPPAVSPSDR